MTNKVLYSERQLIKRAIRQARPSSTRVARWIMVKRIFGTGQSVSREICLEYGFDPDGDVIPMSEMSATEYEENLLQHGIIQ